MSEQARRTYIERTYPAAAAFLAAERGGGPAPVYGPGEVQNAHDDQPEPHVVVRVAYRLSRWELLAAFANGYASANHGQDPDEMTVARIRDDVESYLSLDSWTEMDTHVEEVAAKIEAGDDLDQFAALLRAMDRAFPFTGPPAPAAQQPRYGDGTVTLQTLDRGEVTVDEPAWCTGHDSESVGHFTDITHHGAETVAPIVTAKYGPSQIMTMHISHAPHLVAQPEPYPVLAVELDGHGDLDPADGHNLARALRLAAVRVDRAVAELDRIRGGMA